MNEFYVPENVVKPYIEGFCKGGYLTQDTWGAEYEDTKDNLLYVIRLKVKEFRNEDVIIILVIDKEISKITDTFNLRIPVDKPFSLRDGRQTIINNNFNRILNVTKSKVLKFIIKLIKPL